MNQKNCRLEPDGRLLFSSLSSASLSHAVFNRHGGVSPPPWDSKNVSFGLGDATQTVLQNRKAIKELLGIKRLVSANQVHGSKMHAVRSFPEEDIQVNGYDALVTNVAGVGLMIQQADCQAVLLYDPEKKAVGIAHVGWRGSAADIISETVFTMSTVFSTEPSDLLAAISPSLGPCCAEFVNYETELPAALHRYQVRPNYFDFWAISCDQLRSTGVRQENIFAAEICTYCNRDYYSYRRDRETGRFASVIVLVEG
jgi:YfiH family protein